LGVESWDGTAGGYIVNDLIVRTPVMLAHDASLMGLAPVALPYYGYRWIVGAKGE
jgi:hypothetical protein